MLADADVWIALSPLFVAGAYADREGLYGACLRLLSL